MTEHMQGYAQQEITKKQTEARNYHHKADEYADLAAEAIRLADMYETMAETALGQVEGWQQYLSEITLRAAIPEQRKPERHLSIVRSE